MLQWPSKLPAEVLRNAIDWSARIGADQIANSTAAVIAGSAIIPQQEFAGTVQTVTVAGGLAGERSSIACTIATLSGETMQEIVLLQIVPDMPPLRIPSAPSIFAPRSADCQR